MKHKFLACTLVCVLVLSSILNALTNKAYADEWLYTNESVVVTAKTNIGHEFEDMQGNFVYCTELLVPFVESGAHDIGFVRTFDKRRPADPALAYVALNGATKEKPYIDANGTRFYSDAARRVTQLAVWCVLNQVSPTTFKSVLKHELEAARVFAAEALAHRFDPAYMNTDVYILSDGRIREDNPTNPHDAYNRQDVLVTVPQKSTLRLKKVSSNPEISNCNTYSLEGAEFAIYKDAAKSRLLATATTDAEGNLTVSGLPSGIVWIEETKAPLGFVRDTELLRVHLKANEVAEITFANAPQNDPVGILLHKVDAATGEAKPTGSASLEGARFSVKFYDGQYIEDTLPDTPTRSWIFKTDAKGEIHLDMNPYDYLLSGDNFYLSENSAVFPLGTVVIEELEAPTGYTLLNQKKHVINITPDGVIEDVHSYVAPTIPEEAIRAHLRFVKLDGSTQTPLVKAVFKLTSKTTGESHLLVTDANGVIDTRYLDMEHANENDLALSEDGTIDTSKLDPSYGVSFGGVSTRGALVYDTYELEELRTDTTRTKALIKREVVIDKDIEVLDIGTIENHDIEIRSRLTAEGDTKVILPHGDVELTDVITVPGLTEGHSYRLVSWLVDKDTKETLVHQGEELKQELKVVAAGDTDSVKVTHILSKDLLHKDSDIVAFAELYDGGLLVGTHTDINDAEQTVHVRTPHIESRLLSVDGSKTILPSSETKLIDTLLCRSLLTDTIYTFKTEIHKVDKDGNDLGVVSVSEKNFTSTGDTEEVALELVFNTEGLEEGTRLVALQRLYLGEELKAEDCDLTNKAQTVTVRYPKMPHTGDMGINAPVSVTAALALIAAALKLRKSSQNGFQKVGENKYE